MKNSVKCPYCGEENSMQDLVDYYYREDRDREYYFVDYFGSSTKDCADCKKKLKVNTESERNIQFAFTSEKIKCSEDGKHEFKNNFSGFCELCEDYFPCHHKSISKTKVYAQGMNGWYAYKCDDCDDGLGLSFDGKTFYIKK